MGSCIKTPRLAVIEYRYSEAGAPTYVGLGRSTGRSTWRAPCPGMYPTSVRVAEAAGRGAGRGLSASTFIRRLASRTSLDRAPSRDTPSRSVAETLTAAR